MEMKHGIGCGILVERLSHSPSGCCDRQGRLFSAAPTSDPPFRRL